MKKQSVMRSSDIHQAGAPIAEDEEIVAAEAAEDAHLSVAEDKVERLRPL